MSAQRRFRSACAFAQSDQNLHWPHFRYPRMQSFFMRTSKNLIRLHGHAGRVVFVGRECQKGLFSRWGSNTSILYRGIRGFFDKDFLFFFFFFFFFFLQNVVSDQSLHCLPSIQQFLDKSVVSKMDLFKFQVKYGKSWYVQIGIYLF